MPFQRNIRLLYWIEFFTSLIPAYVIERLYWAQHGMSVQQVVACEMLYAVAIVLLEVPSGVVADMMGRKAMLLIGVAMSFAEFYLLLIAGSFWHFAAAVLLTGIGSAAMSGALNAMIYESLEMSGQQDHFERVLGRLRVIGGVATILAAVLGSLTAAWFGLAFNYQISLASCLLALLGAMLLKEPVRTQKADAPLTVRMILARSRDFFRRRPDALLVILHATLVAGFIIYVDEFWQLYLEGIVFPLGLYGIVMTAFTVTTMAGAALAGWLRRWMGTNLLLCVLSLTVAVGLLVAAAAHSLLGLAAMMLCCCASAAMQVIATGYLHRRADSAARATIESLGSLLERAGVIVLGFVFAYSAERLSLTSAFGVLAALCGALTLVFAVTYRGRIRADEP